MNDIIDTSNKASADQAGSTVPIKREDVEPPVALPTIRKVPTDAPIQWLKLGWKDFVSTRFKGAFYGLVFVLMGYAIAWVYATKWQLTMGLIGGFFLMGPFLCLGLYDLSRQYERTGKASLLSSITCWCVAYPVCFDIKHQFSYHSGNLAADLLFWKSAVSFTVGWCRISFCVRCVCHWCYISTHDARSIS